MESFAVYSLSYQGLPSWYGKVCEPVKTEELSGSGMVSECHVPQNRFLNAV